LLAQAGFGEKYSASDAVGGSIICSRAHQLRSMALQTPCRADRMVLPNLRLTILYRADLKKNAPRQNMIWQ
jgi:hypothetical protein